MTALRIIAALVAMGLASPVFASAAYPNFAAHMMAASTAHSPFPASFNGNPWLYMSALTSLMSRSVFGLCICVWMLRLVWRDRFRFHPAHILTTIRIIFAICGWAAMWAALPELVFNTCYGEVTADTMSWILSCKRIAETGMLPLAASWMALLVLRMHEIEFKLSAADLRSVVYSDPVGMWHRLLKPAIIFVLVVLISFLMAYAKWTMGHHG